MKWFFGLIIATNMWQVSLSLAAQPQPIERVGAATVASPDTGLEKTREIRHVIYAVDASPTMVRNSKRWSIATWILSDVIDATPAKASTRLILSGHYVKDGHKAEIKPPLDSPPLEAWDQKAATRRVIANVSPAQSFSLVDSMQAVVRTVEDTTTMPGGEQTLVLVVTANAADQSGEARRLAAKLAAEKPIHFEFVGVAANTSTRSLLEELARVTGGDSRFVSSHPQIKTELAPLVHRLYTIQAKDQELLHLQRQAINQHRDVVTRLNHHLTGTQQKLDASVARGEALTSKLNEVEKAKAEADETIKRQAEAIAQHRQVIDEVKAQLIGNQQKLDASVARGEALTGKLNEVKKAKAEADETIKHQAEAIAQHRLVIDEVKAQLTGTQQKLDASVARSEALTDKLNQVEKAKAEADATIKRQAEAIAQYRQVIDEVKSQLTGTQQELDASIARGEALTGKLNNVEKAKAEADETIKRQSEAIAQHRQVIDEVKSQLIGTQQKLDASVARSEALTGELNEVEKARADADETIKRQIEAIAQHRQVIDEVQSQLTGTQQKLDASIARGEALTAKLNEVEKAKAEADETIKRQIEAIAQHRQVIDEVKSQLTGTQQKLDASVARGEALAGKLNDVEKAKAEADETIKRQTEVIAQHRHVIDEVKSQLAGTQQNLDASIARGEALAGKLNEVQKAKAEADETIKRQTEAIAQHRQVIDDVQSQLIGTQQKLNASVARSEALTDKLNQVEKAKAEADETIKRQAEAIAQHRLVIDDVKSQLTGTQQKLDASVARGEALTGKLNEVEKAKAEADEMIKRQTEAIAQHRQVIDEVKLQLTGTQQKLDAAIGRCRALSDELCECKIENATKQVKVESLKTEITKLDGEIGSLQSDIACLKERLCKCREDQARTEAERDLLSKNLFFLQDRLHCTELLAEKDKRHLDTERAAAIQQAIACCKKECCGKCGPVFGPVVTPVTSPAGPNNNNPNNDNTDDSGDPNNGNPNNGSPNNGIPNNSVPNNSDPNNGNPNNSNPNNGNPNNANPNNGIPSPNNGNPNNGNPNPNNGNPNNGIPSPNNGNPNNGNPNPNNGNPNNANPNNGAGGGAGGGGGGGGGGAGGSGGGSGGGLLGGLLGAFGL